MVFSTPPWIFMISFFSSQIMLREKQGRIPVNPSKCLILMAQLIQESDLRLPVFLPAISIN